MSQKGLEALLRPKVIAVIGASEKTHRAGYLIIKNLQGGKFHGAILPVTPGYKAVCGILAYPDIESLPLVPDLAIMCTHSQRNPALLEQLGQKGCRGVIILSSLPEQTDELKVCAARYDIRILGPNSLGLLSPWQGLNASFSPVPITPGKLAFITQSSAVANIILDWAQQRNIGFSHFIALGDSLDIDVDDILDYLARDSKTTAIMLYLENISDARRFMSAGRGASRNKPILVIKSGHALHAQRLLQGKADNDAVYDAAIQRAGMLRVHNTHELFSAVETLSYMKPLRGDRLMIISNGAAPAAMSLDALLNRNGRLIQPDEACRAKLIELLPDTITPTNPLNLQDNATPERYQAAINAILDSNHYDAVFVIHAPSATAPSTPTAERVIKTLKEHPRGQRTALFTNWCGEHSSPQARRLFSEAAIPTYRTPEGAITAFMHMVEYRQNQQQLMETPVSLNGRNRDLSQGRQFIESLLSEQRYQLDTPDTQAILQHYGFKTLRAWVARTGVEAVQLAEEIGYPVALKLRLPAQSHLTGIRKVMLYLRDALEVEHAADTLFAHTKQLYPDIKIDGLLVQSMANRANAQELRVVVKSDPVFGPVILLGDGDIHWRSQQDTLVALPPLNTSLANTFISQALKKGKIRHNDTPMNFLALSTFLVRLSNLILNCPEIIHLDVHLLLSTEEELTVLDTNLQIAPFKGDPQARLAIRPYPQELEEWVMLKGNTHCLFRPILPEDEPLLKSFISRVTKEDLYYRYFSEINEFSHEDLAKMTQIDYNREMAFVAVYEHDGISELLGVARALSDPDNIDAEFAVLVRSDLKRIGLGLSLMQKLINYTREHGLERMTGITMPNNHGMIELAKKLGFKVDVQLDEGVVNLDLHLND